MEKRNILTSLLLALILSLFCACGQNAPDRALDNPLVSAEDPIPGGTEAPAPTDTPAPLASIPVETSESAPVPTPVPLPAHTPVPLGELDNDAFVRVLDYIPSIYVDLKYATYDNFTKHRIYPFENTEAYLRCGTVKKLMAAEEKAEAAGYRLKIWDGFRPVSAQFRLWEIVPNPVYVANPNTGFSSHSRGNTVDLTLVSLDGSTVQMPTGFDDFTPKADRDYSDCTVEEAENALFLQNLMIECGFTPYQGEWWHFSDTDSFPVAQSFEPPEMVPETWSKEEAVSVSGAFRHW